MNVRIHSESTTHLCAMTTRLVDLSSDVLGLVVSRNKVYSQGLLKLWQCGSRRLNQKLQQGCTHVRLRDNRVTSLHPVRVPKMIYCLYNLVHLSIKCPALNLKGINTVHRFERLSELSLKCLNLPHITADLNFAWYPLLQGLTLVQTIKTAANGCRSWNIVNTHSTTMPNYLSRLPASLTRLKTSPMAPHIQNSVFAVDVMLTQLPNSLIHLVFAVETRNDRILDTKLMTVPDFPRYIPLHLETMQNLIRLPIGPNTQSLIANMSCTLTRLDLHIDENSSMIDAMPINPLRLTHLDLCIRRPISSEQWRQTWQLISKLPLLESLVLGNNGFVSQSSNNTDMFDYNTWRALLPRHLKHFTSFWRLPIQWSSLVDTNGKIFPPSIQSLYISANDFSNMIHYAPQAVLELTELASLTTFLHGRYFFLNQNALHYLPKSLRRVVLFVTRSVNFEAFGCLEEAELTMSGNNDEPVEFKFPPTMRKITIGQTAHEVMSVDNLFKIVDALPRLLEHLHVYNIVRPKCNWSHELIARLPRGLMTLNLNCDTSQPNWQSCIRALPPTLTKLELGVYPLDNSSFSILTDLLPPNLKRLTLIGCEFLEDANESARMCENMAVRVCRQRPNLEFVSLR